MIALFWRRKASLPRPRMREVVATKTSSAKVSFIDYRQAELTIFGLVQQRRFRREFDELLEKKIDDPQSRRELKLADSSLKALFVGTDGLICVGSRLLQANISDDAKIPIIVMKKDPVVRSYVRFIHKSEARAGPKHTLSQLRNKVWLIHGMQECRSIITKCVTCQKAFKKPLEQKMGILPEIWVTPNPPFKEVGLNLMGVFGVKFPGSRATKKVWGVVFACMSLRSVHVEIVLQMDAQSLMNTIACFSARRPGTTHFYPIMGQT